MSGEKCILEEMREMSEAIERGEIDPNDANSRERVLGSPVCAKCGALFSIDSYEGKRDTLSVTRILGSKPNYKSCGIEGGSNFEMNIGAGTVRAMGFLVDDEGF